MIWNHRETYAISGLREIGFKANSDVLMVLSSQGRGVFDCLTGKRIDRNRLDYYSKKWDEQTGLVEGFGVLEGEAIRCGGFEAEDVLQKVTSDGWEIQVKKEKRENWSGQLSATEVMYLIQHKEDIQFEVGVFYYGIDRAYGFSDTGRSFVLSTSSDLWIWSRQ